MTVYILSKDGGFVEATDDEKDVLFDLMSSMIAENIDAHKRGEKCLLVMRN